MDKYDVLSNMMTINIDLETLGVDPVRDQIYSGAVYSTKKGTGSMEAASFFDIDKGNYPNNMPLEEFLESRHASKFFGKQQQQRGSLAGWAKAASDGSTSTMDSFIENILQHKNTQNEGAILLAQNISFEDRALSAAYTRGDIQTPFTELVKNIVSKGDNEAARYLQPKEITDMNWERFRIIDDNIRPAIKGGSKNALQEGLEQYYQKSLDIVDTYVDHFNKAKTENRIATADLMDFTKAVYAHGAVQGKIDPRLLTYGSKVDFLAETLLGAPELHEAMADAKQQDELFKIMSKEIQSIKKEGIGYQSPIVDKLAAAFKEQRVLEKQVKSSASSFIREYLESPKTKDFSLEGIKKGALTQFHYRNRFIADEGTIEGFNYQTFKEDLNSILDRNYQKHSGTTNPFDRGVFLNDVEEELSDYVHKPRVSDTTKTLFEKHFNKRTAGIIGGAAAAVFGANMMFGGNKEKQREVTYNTYDELYNSQYYGSQFADWQNRNNSHRMM